MRLIGLKNLSLVADDTGIISKILMMLYIAGYNPLFVACRALNSISVLSSTRVHLISNAQSHPQNLLSLVNLSVRYLTIYQLFQVLCLEDLQGLYKMFPLSLQKNPAPRCLLLALISLPLNDPRFPRRQRVRIFSSSIYYIHHRFKH